MKLPTYSGSSFFISFRTGVLPAMTLLLAAGCHGNELGRTNQGGWVSERSHESLRNEVLRIDQRGDFIASLNQVQLQDKLIKGLESGDEEIAYLSARIAGKSACASSSLISALKAIREDDQSPRAVVGPVEIARNASAAEEAGRALRLIESKERCE